MKNYGLRLALLMFGLLALPIISCKKVVKNEAYYEAISRYIYAFTSGDIGRNDVIRVRFVNAAVGQDQVGKSVSAGLFSIDPEIPGQAVWEDDRTIKLQPAEPLPYGKKYEAEVQLSKIYSDVPKEVATFSFEFKVRELSFQVITDGIQSENVNDLRVQSVFGKVYISDPVDNDALEKTLTATQGNKNLSIQWSHSSDGLTHNYVVKGVERSNVRSKVQLKWSTSALGFQHDGASEVTVPALDEFVVLNARVVQDEEQYVLLNFSDPIQPTQSFDGLIRLDGFDGALRYAVDGNFVRVYPGNRITGSYTLRVETGIKNIAGAAMKERSDWALVFESLKPSVRLVGRGAIIPKGTDGSIIFPFEAVGLRAVDIEIFKIYNSNVLQFLQVNELEGEQELDRVGKIIIQRKVDLSSLNPDAKFQSWQRYALDLKDLISVDPGAIYQVRIAFRIGYSIQSCEGAAESDDDNVQRIGARDEAGNLLSVMGGYRGIYFGDYEAWYYDEGEGDEEESDGRFNWNHRDNPCKREYYNYEHFVQRNVFSSDLGMMAKRGNDGSVFCMVTDLLSAEPVGGVDVEFFNYQLQPIGKFRTDGSGTALAEGMRERPFVMVATKGDRRGYLRMADGGSLSLSRFDVAGVEPQKGLKGYIYGERGVWRPGDSLYLNFVLEDNSGKLPANHPLTFELSDPKGRLQYRTTTTNNIKGVYGLPCATRSDAPTGNWTATVKVGGATFTKTLKIETVKPNRLKLDLDFGRKQLMAGEEDINGKLKVNWLHGAVAKNLKAKVEMQVRAMKTEFSNFKDFAFDDPARNFSSDPQVLFEGNIDENGTASVPLELGDMEEAPGKLLANFKVRAFEAGGDFSTDNFSLEYFPYEQFVGVSIPKNRWGDKVIDYGAGTQIQFVCVDDNGRPQAGRKIEVGLYRCDWRWWWDEDNNDNVAQFNSADHVNAQEHATLTTDNRGIATWKVKPGNWGRYLVRASDPESGHSAGDFLWAGYPDDVQDIQSRNAAAMLPFSVGKEKYNVGEEVTLKVPASDNGRILLTLENGTRVVQHLWFDAKAGDNLLKFTTTESMAPTVYAHVSLLQPHAQTKNDLPIRMYGVMPVNVENASSRLQPQIVMPDVLKPGEPFTVQIKETSGKACVYTLDIVDEGLLDLTRFKTPNPWDVFFAREALGVKTWDVFDYVLGAFGTELERILSIGGDGINTKAKNAAQINRFKPAVVHVGPFYLEKGQTATHNLKLDNYVGSVRVMAVCSAPAPNGKGAYGSAEKTCPVRKPLMILPTLPRVLGPNETLKLPVDVFAMEKQVKSATIRIKEANGLVQVQGSSVATLNFDQPGEKMAYFDLKVGKRTGPAKFTITAQGGGEQASAEIELLVRSPNPVTTEIWQGVIEPGKDWRSGYDPGQYADIKSAQVEVSVLPGVNMSKHLDYLIRYPHGCVEQTTSAAFPQLFVDLLTPLDEKQRKSITTNIKAAVDKLQGFQNGDGSFSYWPGGNTAEDWSTSYVGHFLLEAQNKGYALPAGMLDRWATYQTNAARRWNTVSDQNGNWYRFDADLTQAYRLYTLAMAGKPALGDMNRLRERKDLYAQTAYMLAAAYAQAGKPEVARELVAGSWKDDYRYDWCGYTYGSELRDRALILETLVAVGDMKKAEAMMQYICQNLSGGQDAWYWNTQSLSTSLRALSRYVTKAGASLVGPQYSYRVGNGSFQNGDASKVISIADFTEKAYNAGEVNIKNNGGVKLYAKVVVSGQRLAGEEIAKAENIKMDVRYLDMKGAAIDPSKIKQGTDFIAEITIQRKADSPFKFPFNELALSQVVPSGWEIMNSRMNGVNVGGGSPAEYQDVRDDRVLTYFDMGYYYDYKNSKMREEVRTYRIQLNAAYTGHYYLPGISCEGMYDNRIRASVPGAWIEVI